MSKKTEKKFFFKELSYRGFKFLVTVITFSIVEEIKNNQVQVLHQVKTESKDRNFEYFEDRKASTERLSEAIEVSKRMMKSALDDKLDEDKSSPEFQLKVLGFEEGV